MLNATIFVLAVSMSVDAFAVSVGRGAALGRPPVREALRTGLVFGVVEAITPVIGWAVGVAASRFIQSVDHWIAFALLGGVGINMIVNAVRNKVETAPAGGSMSVLLATAVGTSLDAMAVGVSLAFLNVNIWVIAFSIGFATFIMSTGGMMVGRFLGERFGRYAVGLAGVVLSGIGLNILIEHLTAAAQ